MCFSDTSINTVKRLYRMITHIPTGKQFDNRLQCKLHYGSADYNRRLHNNEFSFHDKRSIMERRITTTLRDGEKDI